MNKKIIIIAVLAGFMLGAFSTLAIGVSAKIGKKPTLSNIYKKVGNIRYLQKSSTAMIMTYLEGIYINGYQDSWNAYYTCEKVHEDTPAMITHCSKPESFIFYKRHWKNMKLYKSIK